MPAFVSVDFRRDGSIFQFVFIYWLIELNRFCTMDVDRDAFNWSRVNEEFGLLEFLLRFVQVTFLADTVELNIVYGSQ